MKCFTLSSYRVLAPVQPEESAAERYTIRPYPTAVPGLKIDWRDRCLGLSGGFRIPASNELLESTANGSVVRDGAQITVLRAGFDRVDGRPILTKEDGTDKALVYIDVTGSPVVRFRSEDETSIVYSGETIDLGATQQRIIAVLERGKPPVIAVREKRKWKLNGLRLVAENRPHEELHIKFDGNTVFYDVVNSQD
jgi:hypothetical protein